MTQKLVNKANRIPLTKIKEIKPNKYVYIHQNGKMSNIDLVEKLCSCNTMADKGLCEHLVKVALISKPGFSTGINSRSLPGLIHEKTLTIRLRHSKKKENQNKIISEDSESNSDFELENIPVENEIQTEIIPLKPAENAISRESKPRGRPPKVLKALDDSPTPITRKSKRNNKVLKYTK